MKASELSLKAKGLAYTNYLNAMNDDLNREDVLAVKDWESESDWDELEYDENGNVI